ncbi:HIT family protein [Caballeronia glathei]|uniref:HIT family protein n=1 Tax=Caballeronia glathei TaxID=60547 RepID=UPI002795E664|nr:HIT family protein [Caballeronia glathei]
MWIRDGFPDSPGHSLVIPRRHVRSFFHVSTEERDDLFALLDQAKANALASFQPDGFNIGINDGPGAAGGRSATAGSKPGSLGRGRGPIGFPGGNWPSATGAKSGGNRGQRRLPVSRQL